MAETIHLPDGSMEVLFSKDDFQNLIREKLGFDAEQKLIEIIEEADYTQAKIDTDLESYEASLESNTACFQEILSSTESMIDILSDERMNRKKLLKLAQHIELQINNQI